MKKRGFAIVGVIGLAVLWGALPTKDDGNAFPLDARADRIVVEKSRHEMILYRNGERLRSYRVSLGRGGLAPKTRKGDNLTPEGLYRISGRNPQSAYHLSLRISYPEPRDVEAARARDEPPGSDIMIHGIRNGLGWLGSLHRYTDWTAGCIAVTNKEIEEIWRAIPDGVPIEIKS